MVAIFAAVGVSLIAQGMGGGGGGGVEGGGGVALSAVSSWFFGGQPEQGGGRGEGVLGCYREVDEGEDGRATSHVCCASGCLRISYWLQSTPIASQVARGAG